MQRCATLLWNVNCNGNASKTVDSILMVFRRLHSHHRQRARPYISYRLFGILASHYCLSIPANRNNYGFLVVIFGLVVKRISGFWKFGFGQLAQNACEPAFWLRVTQTEHYPKGNISCPHISIFYLCPFFDCHFVICDSRTYVQLKIYLARPCSDVYNVFQNPPYVKNQTV